MSAKSSTAAMPGWYGAFELKQVYQRNLGMGVLFAALLHLVLIGGLLVYQYIKTHGDVEPIGIVRIKSMSDIAPPPSMTTAKPQVNVAEPNIAPPTIGIPTPVPDEEAVEDVRFATRAEMAELSAPVVAPSTSGGSDSVVVDASALAEEYFPQAGEFVAVEEQPVEISHESPKYPEMAGLTQKIGTVWIQALVDKEGKVRDARVLKPSGSNVGFEEAAVEAAYKNRYKPAIQNGRPVAVWISYKVDFQFNH
jgi:periplasmic protein TonB